MPTPAPRPLPPRRTTFQPRFTLGLLYVVVFFLVYAMLLVAPELIEVWREVPPGPEQEEVAKEVARQAARPRLPIALAAAVVTTALGTYARILPGLRRS